MGAEHDSVATGRRKSNGIVKRPGETLKQRHEPEVARGGGGGGEKGFPSNLGPKCPNLILSYTFYLPTINASYVCIISASRFSPSTEQLPLQRLHTIYTH